ncbi:acetylcholinesterase-1-like [Oppia nitens]|uniref:acetylcholinesterase-1-like n=1 Tax=Oppia nitens TaxID=1686743 RepID=UPI0023DCDA9B|nr:acetylcholinesterase-1-like [Oppia nitens]
MTEFYKYRNNECICNKIIKCSVNTNNSDGDDNNNSGNNTVYYVTVTAGGHRHKTGGNITCSPKTRPGIECPNCHLQRAADRVTDDDQEMKIWCRTSWETTKRKIRLYRYHIVANCLKPASQDPSFRGLTLHIKNSVLEENVDQFLGIPYAVPPIGELRFAKPLPITTPAKDIIDATKTKYWCMQSINDNMRSVYGIFNTSEDCLTLNIWRKNDMSSTLKPVMFWIHGGGFIAGSSLAPIYNGSVLAINDVVVVSANYRLGVFGFTFGDREDAPGNVALFDQLLALKWVRDNIHKFGGDRDSITIFGESAGSMSVSAHILSPLSKGLFKRAIMQSGAHMFNKDRDVITKTDAIHYGKQMAKDFKCTDSDNWIQCLRKVDKNELTKKFQLITRAVVGTQFLPLSTSQAFKQNKFNSEIDIIAGINRNEGHTYYEEQFTIDVFMKYLHNIDKEFHGFDLQKVADFYLIGVDKTNSDSLKRSLDEFIGDALLKCPTYLFAKQVAKRVNIEHNKAFFYELTYMSQFFGKISNCEPSQIAICHLEDLPFVFGLPLLSPELYTQQDIVFSRQVQQLWTDFAKIGKPHHQWPQLLTTNTTFNSRVKDLNPINKTKIFDHLFDKTCDTFWYNYYL